MYINFRSFSLLPVAIAMFAMGCDHAPQHDTTEHVSPTATTDALTVTGELTTTDGPLAGATVALFQELEDGKTYMVAEATTNESGCFVLNVDEPGEYLFGAGVSTDDGAYVMPDGEPAYVWLERDQPDDLGSIELEYVAFDYSHESGYSTVEGALGWGEGCLAIGCSFKYLLGIKWGCCGVSLCIAGVQGCIPIWKA